MASLNAKNRTKRNLDEADDNQDAFMVQYPVRVFQLLGTDFVREKPIPLEFTIIGPKLILYHPKIGSYPDKDREFPLNKLKFSARLPVIFKKIRLFLW